MAQDLLQNCLTVESHLDAWLATVGSTYWLQPPSEGTGHMPFPETYAFPSGPIALAFLSLWTAQLVFFPCVERLHWTVFEPVVDGLFPPPLMMLGDPSGRYGRKAVADAAERVCRGLDYALERTVMPDMLGVPLGVARQFWDMVAAEGQGEGRLEGMWCEGFRGRLEAKGGEMREVVQGRGWWDFGGW